MNNLIIIGAGGHGKSVEWIANQLNLWNKIFFLDDQLDSKEIIGKVSDRFNYKGYDFFIAIGDNQTRKNLFETLVTEGFKIISIISPTAIITNSKIGKNVVVMNYSLLNVNSTVGDGVIINNFVNIEHDCVIGNFTHVSPNVKLGGNTNVGFNSWVGIGSTIINNINVCDSTIIGAGAVVIKDISEGGVYVGVPAKRLR